MHPAPHLAGLVSGYHIYSAGPLGGPAWQELFFPGWANLRLTLRNGDWHCAPVGEPLRPVPLASLFGPASRGLNSLSHGGLMVGVGITPLGWHRFFAQPAHGLADRIVPLVDYISGDVAALHAAACADPTPNAIKHLFDDWLTHRLRPPSALSPAIARLFDWLATTHEVDVVSAEQALGLLRSQLRRLARHHFGFSAKLLLRRSRFLKSITRVIAAPSDNWSEAIDASYYDYAHFVRDCQDFLGMAPRQFLALERPMTHLSLATRTRQLGAPLQGLHHSGLPVTPTPDP